jgi:hypothetical protein
MNILKLANEIDFDLDIGVYDRWPKVKSRMQYIYNKLIKMYYVENADELSENEIHYLKEQGYIL